MLIIIILHPIILWIFAKKAKYTQYMFFRWVIIANWNVVDLDLHILDYKYNFLKRSIMR